jgi:hypothetical protein
LYRTKCRKKAHLCIQLIEIQAIAKTAVEAFETIHALIEDWNQRHAL